MISKCPKGHQNSWNCHKAQPKACIKCGADDRRVQKEKQRALKLQEKREQQEREHLEHIAKLDEMLENERQRLRDQQLLEERSRQVQQKEQDLVMARTRLAPKSESLVASPGVSGDAASGNKAVPTDTNTTTQRSHLNSPRKESTSGAKVDIDPYWKVNGTSPAKQDWEQQKRVGNARNDAIDTIMNMVGLEAVKTQVLLIKASIDLSMRQNANTKDRLNAAFLGNPGTGSYYHNKTLSAY